MRYDADHKQKTRERVLKAAAKEIRAEGPHRVGVAAVMAKAGLTHGGFYAHFDSKDALIAATIEHMFESVKDRFAHETEGKSAANGLKSYIDFYLSVLHRDALANGCPIAALIADQPRLAAAARKRFTQGVARLTGSLGEMIDRLENGHSAAEASSVLAELVGALTLARAEPDEDLSRAILDNSRRALKTRLDLH